MGKASKELDELTSDSGFAGFIRQTMDHRLTVLLLAYVLGILLDKTGKVPLRGWLIGCLIGLVGWGMVCGCGFVVRSVSFRRAGLSIVLFLVAIVCVAGSWHHLRWRYYLVTELGLAARDTADPVCLAGTVVDFPRLIDAMPSSPLDTIPSEDQTRFRIRCQSVRNGTVWEPATGCAQVAVTGHCTDLRAGDRVRLIGQLVRPSNAMNPGEFDFREHERAHRQLFRLLASSPECVECYGRAAVWDIRWYPQRLRGLCQRILFRYLPRPQAELACAMLMGARDYLSDTRREAFFLTGTIHLLAISGLHVGILAGAFFFVMQRTNLCTDGVLLAVIAVLTLVYAVITEGKPPVMRASILIWIVCLARTFHRDGFAINSLSAAALVILLINPAQLFLVGFHLSFLAVIALVWLAPRLIPERKQDPLSKLIDKSRPGWERRLRLFGRQVLYASAASLSIWCLTLPVAAHHFHLISPIGLVLNVFLWIPVAVALFAGFATLATGALIPPLAKVSGAICANSFWCLESVVQWSQSIPGSYQWVAGPSRFVVYFFYLSLLLVVVSRRLRSHSLKWFVAIAALSVAISWPTRFKMSDELRCTFLSVGHGSCVVVELPNGQVWLYDAGSISGPNFAVDAVCPYLWQRRIDRLDVILVSHADVDHFNGVPELLKRFAVGKVITSPTMFSVDEDAVEVLRESIAVAGIPIETVSAGYRLPVVEDAVRARQGGVASVPLLLQVLHPPTSGVEGSDNANSIVLRIEYLGKSILLSGDIEFAGLERLLALRDMDTDVAMAPHHGSVRSEPDRFVDWCQPEWVIISSGNQQDIDSVCRIYDRPMTRVLHTARDGAVTVLVNSTGISVQPNHDRTPEVLDIAAGSIHPATHVLDMD